MVARRPLPRGQGAAIGADQELGLAAQVRPTDECNLLHGNPGWRTRRSGRGLQLCGEYVAAVYDQLAELPFGSHHSAAEVGRRSHRLPDRWHRESRRDLHRSEMESYVRDNLDSHAGPTGPAHWSSAQLAPTTFSAGAAAALSNMG